MNQDFVGKRYPPVPFSVTFERVRAFAEAIGDPGEPVPPTFATAPEIASLDQVIGDADLNLDYARVVHGEQEFEWSRPLALGDELMMESTIASIRAKGDLEWLVVETELRDATGQLAVRARNTLIVRGAAST